MRTLIVIFSRRNDRDRKKRRETTGGIEFSWNRPGTSKHTRLQSASTFSFPQVSSKVFTGKLLLDSIFRLFEHDKNYVVDQFEPSDSSGTSVVEKVKGERQEPDGDSQEGESEWDEMSVLETFARLV